ncbi:uncharacterized protein LOC120563433 isoform X2 [Perca fluviatilis]|uniref:uncharacterized protein LOC120563433 isoform X2 n=1 Tax=Perca fluviatilis TaxID=8168 RepID=UPI001966150B|nr:uncharacterized protein LOC120563433 isoform X2 [Perca fluviatilis]
MPTMSPCPSTLQLTPLVCLGLLCLLLLFTDSTVSKKGSTQPLNTTQANCSTALIPGGVCSPGDNGDVSVNATDLQLKGHLKGEQEDQFPTSSSLSVSHTSISHALNDSVALIQPSTITGSPTPAAHTEPTSSAGATTTAATQPVGNVVPTASLGTSATTPAPPSAATNSYVYHSYVYNRYVYHSYIYNRYVYHTDDYKNNSNNYTTICCHNSYVYNNANIYSSSHSSTPFNICKSKNQTYNG